MLEYCFLLAALICHSRFATVILSEAKNPSVRPCHSCENGNPGVQAHFYIHPNYYAYAISRFLKESLKTKASMEAWIPNQVENDSYDIFIYIPSLI